ncbi:hypothetical protein TIFTF001_031365 [Ficus carica]|uniref:Uncharacterized protein n=1 Tax=Ficus carica TaxID=3494 RepID=A0AA88DUM6_FICCA|nr:hypothetical protein TIFTF001_031365 [Ficus carica]
MLKDYIHPTRTATPSCIMFSPNMPQQDFKPCMIQLLPTFHGLESENLYVHILEFEEVVATFHSRAEVADFVRLKFFPFSLNDMNHANNVTKPDTKSGNNNPRSFKLDENRDPLLSEARTMVW